MTATACPEQDCGGHMVALYDTEHVARCSNWPRCRYIGPRGVRRWKDLEDRPPRFFKAPDHPYCPVGPSSRHAPDEEIAMPLTVVDVIGDDPPGPPRMLGLTRVCVLCGNFYFEKKPMRSVSEEVTEQPRDN